MKRVAILLALACLPISAADAAPPDWAATRAPRPRIGVAFGGGSARGLAHVGIIRWFEEHRIPIDLVAGTSMGGLIGGAFASGLSADELAGLIGRTDWDEMFGFSPFRYKNIRRKEDARAYPSRIELGTRHGIVLPPALNSGQQVDFLVLRVVGPYGTLSSFDDLPTPFRAMAVDFVTAEQVVLEKGSLASALRATMSLPGIFPPVERDGRVLVDGGAMNNVPADVVRAMGADTVIAINVGYVRDTRVANRSFVAVMGQTVDVMMEASARTAMKAADIVITPPLAGFGSLDFRRSAELAEAGYGAADAMKAVLLPLALDEAQWRAYQEQRRARRKSAWPTPQFLSVVGAVPSDRARIEATLARRVGQPLEVDGLEADLETFAGLDRYETVQWQLAEVDGRPGLQVDVRPKAYAPPFLMLGASLQNTTTSDFAFQLAARYLAFDVAGSGSELRLDAAVGVEPTAAAELYRPVRHGALFVAASALARRETLNFVSEDVVVARYREDRAAVGFDVGVNVGRDSDVRAGLSIGHLSTSVETGDPELPELHGRETRGRLAWRYDGQDNPVIPKSGTRAAATLQHVFDSPEPPPEFTTDRSNRGITQAEFRGSSFWSRGRRDRLFLSGGAGTSWGRPLANEQFQLGAPMRLGAYSAGELRGDHYAVLTTGYLRGVRRLPDFLGGMIFAGGWLENGSAFADIGTAKLRTNVSVGVMADTLVGPALLAASADFRGAWRYYVGVGRLF